MSERTVALFVQDIIDAIRSVNDYTAGLTYEDFTRVKIVVDAVVRNLEIIGEAVNHLPESVLKTRPEVPWSRYVGMRDRITHAYFGVSLQIVWETVQEDLPTLKRVMEEIKTELV